MRLIWVIVSLQACVLLECGIASCGLLVPLTLLCGFYHSCAQRGLVVALPSLTGCVMLDLCLGRPFPVTAVVYLASLPGAAGWRRFGNLEDWRMQAFPGLFLGLAAWLCTFLYVCFVHVMARAHGALFDWRLLMSQVLGGMLCLPPLVWILDHFARRMLLPYYTSVTRYRSFEQEDLRG